MIAIINMYLFRIVCLLNEGIFAILCIALSYLICL